MKRFVLITIFGILCLGMQGVYAQSTSQNRPSNTERQLSYLEKVEENVFTLPYDLDHIQNEFIPIIHTERSNLAPNYPDRSTLQRNETVIKSAFLSWIEDHPAEYTAYLKYLLQFIEDHN